MMIALVIVLSLANLLLWSDIFYRQLFKRFYDVVLSGLALIALSPILLLLTVLGAIKVKGNPFFTQERPGKNERIFNGNKIITGSAGGCFLKDSLEDANKVRKWSTHARENAPWYQHEELGFNYSMFNVIASVVRGQYEYLDEHIAQKRAIYERYREGLKDLPVKMNPFKEDKAVPNFWLSCLIIDKDAMCRQVRSETEALYIPEKGKSCPTEILEAISSINAEGRPIWKPMHAHPIYRMNPFITVNGSGRAKTNAYIAGEATDAGMDIFSRGLCLPSNNKTTEEQEERIIRINNKCFG